MELKLTKTTTQEDLTKQRAGGGNSAGPLLQGVIHGFVVGEERRCLARVVINELAPHAFIVIPKTLRVIGGHDLLWNTKERSVPIPGVFDTLAAASDAGKAWATSYNETQC